MQLLEKWYELSKSGTNVSQRILPTGLPQYVGIDAQGRWIFYSTSSVEPKAWSDVKLVQVSAREYSGSWNLTLTLMDSSYSQEFAYLCQDLVGKVAGLESEYEALEAQRLAFLDWKEFFKGGRSLSSEAARGLFGELSFLDEQIQAGETAAVVVRAWNGPMGAPQDFVFDEFRAVEIKTIQPQVPYVRIANENQLEFHGALTLRILVIQENADVQLGATLVELVSSISEKLDAPTAAEFARRLLKVGYSAELPIATEMRFSIGDSYSLDPSIMNFPKITAASAPPGISNIEYRIALSAILGKGFEC